MVASTADFPVASTADFPIASAMSAYIQSAHQFDLAGSLDGTNYTMNYSYTPNAGTFEGSPAIAVLQAAVLKANGVVAGQRSTLSYFAVDPFVSHGSFDQADGSLSVLNQMGAIPATAKVGQSGRVGNWIKYSDRTMTQVVGTTTVTWSLEADTTTTALLCMNAESYGNTRASGSDCYRADAGGRVTGLVVKIVVNEKTLTLQ